MSINTKELQKFLDLWSPVLAALPAVINSLDRKEELQRGVAILQKQADDAQLATTTAIEARKAGLAEVSIELQVLSNKKREQTLLAKEHEKACAERIAQATADAEAQVAAAQADSTARVAAATTAAADAESILRAKLAEVDSAVSARAKELQASIDALEARRAAAEKALNALRAKLE